MARVQQADEAIDLRVHDGLAHQRQRAVPWLHIHTDATHHHLKVFQVAGHVLLKSACHCQATCGHSPNMDMASCGQTSSSRPSSHLHALAQSTRLDAGNAPELVDHAHMVTQRTLHYLIWAVHLPSPLTAHCSPPTDLHQTRSSSTQQHVSACDLVHISQALGVVLSSNMCSTVCMIGRGHACRKGSHRGWCGDASRIHTCWRRQAKALPPCSGGSRCHRRRACSSPHARAACSSSTGTASLRCGTLNPTHTGPHQNPSNPASDTESFQNPTTRKSPQATLPKSPERPMNMSQLLL